LPESFLALDRTDRQDIYAAFARASGRTPLILEKDVWICWTLGALFDMGGALPMAFKGGTSLSKVFNAISRFSEDVDVTIAYRSLDDSFDPYADGVSNNAVRRFKEHLDGLVGDHVRDVVVPDLRLALAAEFGFGPESVTVDPASGQNVLVSYPSALGERDSYVADRVLVEFGGRNSILPSDVHEVLPYLAESDLDLELPAASPNVLSPLRTFWEKATLIHVECNRNAFRSETSRISRHWYDLDQLAMGDIGARAVGDRDLLADVVRVKKAFYNSGSANYDACLAGGLRLVPAEDGLKVLKRDYDSMVQAGMIEGEAPSFDGIVSRLRDLEDQINGL
jgi:hypothetical protein